MQWSYARADSLLNRKALQEYILLAGQHPAGGLRDKPPKHADSYHTLSCLAGLSAAQHRVFPSPERRRVLEGAWKGAFYLPPAASRCMHVYLT
jgi:protein farnesyltransferase subunit beta